LTVPPDDAVDRPPRVINRQDRDNPRFVPHEHRRDRAPVHAPPPPRRGTRRGLELIFLIQLSPRPTPFSDRKDHASRVGLGILRTTL
jgi:hypothetical protein